MCSASPGIAGGVAAILCCVGPTILALIGVMITTVAFSLATNRLVAVLLIGIATYLALYALTTWLGQLAT